MLGDTESSEGGGEDPCKRRATFSLRNLVSVERAPITFCSLGKLS